MKVFIFNLYIFLAKIKKTNILGAKNVVIKNAIVSVDMSKSKKVDKSMVIQNSSFLLLY